MWLKLTEERALREIGEGMPWAIVRETTSEPKEAFENLIKDMISRGILVDDGKYVKPKDWEK